MLWFIRLEFSVSLFKMFPKGGGITLSLLSYLRVIWNLCLSLFHCHFISNFNRWDNLWRICLTMLFWQQDLFFSYQCEYAFFCEGLIPINISYTFFQLSEFWLWDSHFTPSGTKIWLESISIFSESPTFSVYCCWALTVCLFTFLIHPTDILVSIYYNLSITIKSIH